jgi:hypothetical protein
VQLLLSRLLLLSCRERTLSGLLLLLLLLPGQPLQTSRWLCSGSEPALLLLLLLPRQ